MVNTLISIRVPSDILQTLNETAIRHNTTKSVLIRELLANAEQFYGYLERQRKQYATAVKEKMPADFNPAMAEMMGRMMYETMLEVARQMIAEKGGDKSAK